MQWPRGKAGATSAAHYCPSVHVCVRSVIISPPVLSLRQPACQSAPVKSNTANLHLRLVISLIPKGVAATATRTRITRTSIRFAAAEPQTRIDHSATLNPFTRGGRCPKFENAVTFSEALSAVDRLADWEPQRASGVEQRTGA